LGLLKLEQGTDLRGNSVLVIRKSRGKISVSELQEELRRDYRYQGYWGIIFKADEEGGYQGWGDHIAPKGDVLELYRIGDGEDCPICNEIFNGIDCCPHCGEQIKEQHASG
jgi:hypothetical protein